MIRFDGRKFADDKARALKSRLKRLLLRHPTPPKIACVLFTEDEGGVVYTKQKQELAKQVGIGFSLHKVSITDPIEKLASTIKTLGKNSKNSGIMIQKPTGQTYRKYFGEKPPVSFDEWWTKLIEHLPLQKDVDGLHPGTLSAVMQGTWQQQKLVLPATSRAVLSILEEIEASFDKEVFDWPILIIGRSQLMGLPLYYVLKHRGPLNLSLVGRDGLKEAIETKKIKEFHTVVSATGVPGLVDPALLKKGTHVIDCGFPKGDLDVSQTEALNPLGVVSPVPYGVGPVTVVSLLENAVELWYNSLR